MQTNIECKWDCSTTCGRRRVYIHLRHVLHSILKAKKKKAKRSLECFSTFRNAKKRRVSSLMIVETFSEQIFCQRTSQHSLCLILAVHHQPFFQVSFVSEIRGVSERKEPVSRWKLQSRSRKTTRCNEVTHFHWKSNRLLLLWNSQCRSEELCCT